MPDFPRYNSKATPTTQQPSVLAPEDRTGSVIAEAGQKIGSQVQDMTMKWSNAVDTIQKTTAKANFKTGMLDIMQRAENDPDYNNSDSYFKEIEKLKTNNLKGFSSKFAETESSIEFDYEAKVGRIQIENLYKKKMIDVGQASTMRLLDIEAKNPTPDMENRISSILSSQIQSGIIGHKDAYELQQKYVKQGRFNAFLSDMNASPSMTETNLSKNSYGFDLKEIESAKKILETESNKIQAVTQNDMLGRYLLGEDPPTEQEVKQSVRDGKIDASFADGMISKLNNPNPDKLSQDEAYIEFQNKVMDVQSKGDKATTKEIIGLMTDTMQAHAKGLLDKADVERILKDRNELVQKKLERVSEDILGKTNPKRFLERISFWSDEYADKKPEIKARMYRKLIDGMMQGQDADLLLTKVIDDEIEIQMSENLKASDRRFAINPDTKKRAYSDDGGATWFDEKSGKEIK